MATKIITIASGTPTRAEGLCTQCWHATLWHIPVYTITDTGVTPLATWTGCTECKAMSRETP
jgi:hypothetical protein